MRLIDADELYKEIIQNEDLARDRVISTEEMIGDRVNPMFTRYCAQLDEQSAFKYMIMDAPTIEAEPVRHGHYVGEGDGYANGELVYDVWKCSECGCVFEDEYEKPTYNYCPNCGADMRTKETDCDYERAVEQLEHDMLYEPTFNQDDGSM